MQLEIITPDKTVVNETHVDEVLVPTASGQIGILPHHMNLVAQIIQGEIIVKQKGTERILAITGGFLEVHNGNVSIIADYAMHADEINIEKAIAAQKRAEEVLKKKKETVSERDFAIAEAELRKSIVEINVAKRRHRKHI